MTAIQVALLCTIALSVHLWTYLLYVGIVGYKAIPDRVLTVLFTVSHVLFGAAFVLFLMEVM